MTFVLFLLYAAIGGGAGYGVFTLTDVGLPMSIAAGGIVTALLGQIHLLATSGRSNKELDERIDRVERTVRDSAERVDVVVARTDAVEATVKHELTERRDALVTEMKQLESLIDRLSKSFESKLTETTSAAIVAPEEDAVPVSYTHLTLPTTPYV